MILTKNAFRLSALVLLLTLVALPLHPAQADAPPTALVTAARAVVYAGPGAGFWSFGSLRQGAAVPVIGVVEDESFWKVKTDIGVGYVRATDVTVTGGETVEIVDPGPMARVTADSAVVRFGPGPTASRVGVLATGAQFFVLSAQPDGTWIEILFKSGRGWVNASLTDVTADVLDMVPQAPGPTAIVNTSFLNVRSGPGLQYTKVTTLPGSTVVPIIGQNKTGSWLLVTTPAGDGWLNAQEVITRNYYGGAPVVNPTETSAELSYNGKMKTSANLRSGPGLAFDSLGVVADGSTVKILGQSRDKAWWYVDAGTSLGNGWINKSVITTERDFSNLPFAN